MLLKQHLSATKKGEKRMVFWEAYLLMLLAVSAKVSDLTIDLIVLLFKMTAAGFVGAIIGVKLTVFVEKLAWFIFKNTKRRGKDG